jgi:hypothetical protein
MDMMPSNSLRLSRGAMERLLSLETRISLQYNGMCKTVSGQTDNI